MERFCSGVLATAANADASGSSAKRICVRSRNTGTEWLRCNSHSNTSGSNRFQSSCGPKAFRRQDFHRLAQDHPRDAKLPAQD
jgi:hypothetical protein